MSEDRPKRGRKLTWNEAREIRERYAKRTNMKKLAEEYGISVTAIRQIIEGKTYGMPIS